MYATNTLPVSSRHSIELHALDLPVLFYVNVDLDLCFYLTVPLVAVCPPAVRHATLTARPTDEGQIEKLYREVWPS